MAKLTKILIIRITPELSTSIDKYAYCLKLRRADVVRFILAKSLVEVQDIVARNYLADSK